MSTSHILHDQMDTRGSIQYGSYCCKSYSAICRTRGNSELARNLIPTSTLASCIFSVYTYLSSIGASLLVAGWNLEHMTLPFCWSWGRFGAFFLVFLLALQIMRSHRGKHSEVICSNQKPQYIFPWIVFDYFCPLLFLITSSHLTPGVNYSHFGLQLWWKNG